MPSMNGNRFHFEKSGVITSPTSDITDELLLSNPLSKAHSVSAQA